MKILVVDDSFVTRNILKNILAQREITEESIVEAPDGSTALEILKTQPVDAILLDLDLPDINGWEVLAELQNDPNIMGIPVIIISAMDFPQILYTHGRQVFDVMMRRPFSKQEMGAVLNAILENVKPIYPRVTNSSA